MSKTQENTSGSLNDSSFEQALKELEAIVRKLENGSGDLEASINDYVQGTKLKEFCQKKLADARLKVESILRISDKNGHDDAKKNNDISLQPFDAK